MARRSKECNRKDSFKIVCYWSVRDLSKPRFPPPDEAIGLDSLMDTIELV